MSKGHIIIQKNYGVYIGSTETEQGNVNTHSHNSSFMVNVTTANNYMLNQDVNIQLHFVMNNVAVILDTML